MQISKLASLSTLLIAALQLSCAHSPTAESRTPAEAEASATTSRPQRTFVGRPEKPEAKVAGQKCGSERWDVKTLTDTFALKNESQMSSQINDLISQRTTPTTTVLGLINEKVPTTLKPWKATSPRSSEEQNVVRVEALVMGYKLESDKDYHIVISDPKDPKHKTMIAEIPEYDCEGGEPKDLVPIPPVYDAVFKSARSQFDSILEHNNGPKAGADPEPVPTFFTVNPPIKVIISGVVFFDKLHGQTGVAANGIELHPVVNVEEDTSTP